MNVQKGKDLNPMMCSNNIYRSRCNPRRITTINEIKRCDRTMAISSMNPSSRRTHFLSFLVHYVALFQTITTTTISPWTTSNALSPTHSFVLRANHIVQNHQRLHPRLCSSFLISSKPTVIKQGQPLMSSGNEAEFADTDSVANGNYTSSIIMQREKTIRWMVRPAQLQDKDKVDALLKISYSTLLPNSYSPEILSKALPKICTAQESLLTCGTWYVVEDPQTGDLVGCGGYTMHAPGPPLDRDDGTDGVDDWSTTTTTSSSRPIYTAPHLRHFATHPMYGRKGVATAIWNHSWNAIVEHFTTQGQPAPAIEVMSSLTAESFYSSLEFEKVKSLTIPLGDDCDFPATLMRRSAPPPAGGQQ